MADPIELVRERRSLCPCDSGASARTAREVPVIAGQRITPDDEVTGFGVRVTAAGARSYVLRYTTRSGRERTYCARPMPGRIPLLSHSAARHQCDGFSTVMKPSRCKHSSTASVVANSSPLSL
jgi:hypothetical protein